MSLWRRDRDDGLADPAGVYPGEPSVEIARFEYIPVGDAALTRITADSSDPVPEPEEIALVVRNGHGDERLEMLPDSRIDPNGRLHVAFAAPHEVMSKPGARFALQIGDSVTDLPQPTRRRRSSRRFERAPDEMTRLRSYLADAERDRDAARDVMDLLRLEVGQLRDRLSQLERERDDAEARAGAAAATAQEADARAGALAGELGDVRGELAAAERERYEAQLRGDQLSEALDEERGRAETFAAERDQSQAAAAELRAELDAARARVAAFEASLATERERAEALGVAVAGERRQSQALSSELEGVRGELAAAERERDEASERGDVLSDALDEERASAEAVAAERDESRAAANHLCAELDAERQRAEGLTSEVEAERRRIAALESKLEEERERTHQTATDLEAARGRATRLAAEVAEQKEAIADLERERYAERARGDGLAAELDDVRMRISALDVSLRAHDEVDGEAIDIYDALPETQALTRAPTNGRPVTSPVDSQSLAEARDRLAAARFDSDAAREALRASLFAGPGDGDAEGAVERELRARGELEEARAAFDHALKTAETGRAEH